MFKNLQAFTLIEILIVMLIISIVTSVSLFSFNRSSRPAILAAATGLKDTLLLAQETAILSNVPIGLIVSSHSYQLININLFPIKEVVNSFSLNMSNDGKLIKKHFVSSKINLKLQTSPQVFSPELIRFIKSKPQILILPDGSYTPFKLFIQSKNGKITYQITADIAGNLTLTQVVT